MPGPNQMLHRIASWTKRRRAQEQSADGQLGLGVDNETRCRRPRKGGAWKASLVVSRGLFRKHTCLIMCADETIC
jgi:hypothetical protein